MSLGSAGLSTWAFLPPPLLFAISTQECCTVSVYADCGACHRPEAASGFWFFLGKAHGRIFTVDLPCPASSP